jgi:hypothetical protein
LVAADMREITNVGLKLIPVALVGKADNSVKVVLTQEFTHSGPATCSFLTAELGQAKASFATVYHLPLPRFIRIFFSLYEFTGPGSRNRTGIAKSQVLDFARVDQRSNFTLDLGPTSALNFPF